MRSSLRWAALLLWFWASGVTAQSVPTGMGSGSSRESTGMAGGRGAQEPAGEVTVAKPLPRVEDLIARAEARQVAVEELRRSYTYKQTETGDEFDAHGNKKDTHTDVYQVWMVKDVTLRQHLAHDGKPLSPEEAQKEQERVAKETEAIKEGNFKAQRSGNVTLKLSTLLKMVTFTNERRTEVNGRPTIQFDYRGDPKAKAGDLGQEVMKKLAGQVWVDEQDAALVRMQGSLADNFRVAGGLLVNIKAGSWFDLRAEHIHDEIWFPEAIRAHVDGRVLLVKGFDGDGIVSFADYRKMQTSVTILPGTRVVDENGNSVPEGPAAAVPEATPPAPSAGPAPK